MSSSLTPASGAEPTPATTPLLGEALRYLIASVLALALDATVLWSLNATMHPPVWLAGAAAYGAGLVFIYLLSIRWVFGARTVRKASSEFLVFAGLGVFGLVLNSIVLATATHLGIGLMLAKLLSAGIGFVANFVTRKLVLFTSQSTS